MTEQVKELQRTYQKPTDEAKRTTSSIVQSPLLEILNRGSENAKTGSELEDILGWSKGAARREVARLRKLGVLVCASNQGYYTPKTLAEAKHYSQRFRKRINETKKAHRAFKQFDDA